MVKIGDWLSEGWALIKEDIVTFAVAALLAGLIGSVTGGICAPPLSVGILMMIGSRMRGEPVAIGDVFKGFQKFGPAFLAALLVSVVIGVGGGIIAVIAMALAAIPLIGWLLSIVLFVALGAAALAASGLLHWQQAGCCCTSCRSSRSQIPPQSTRSRCPWRRQERTSPCTHLPAWCSAWWLAWARSRVGSASS